MASTTVTVLTPALTGTIVTAKGSVASGETVTIAPTTAQGALDFRTLKIRVINGGSAVTTLTLAASSIYSAGGQGAATVTLGSAATVIIGGQFFESSRFQNTAETIIFSQAGVGPTSWEAYQAPRASE